MNLLCEYEDIDDEEEPVFVSAAHHWQGKRKSTFSEEVNSPDPLSQKHREYPHDCGSSGEDGGGKDDDDYEGNRLLVKCNYVHVFI